MGYQNIRGTTLNSGLKIPEELDVMRELGIDTQGMSEINKPWSIWNRWQYQMMTNIMFKNSKTSFSSAPAAHDCKNQPGGNLLILTGDGAGRAQKTDGNKSGRFCWQTIRGARDEGNYSDNAAQGLSGSKTQSRALHSVHSIVHGNAGTGHEETKSKKTNTHGPTRIDPSKATRGL